MAATRHIGTIMITANGRVRLSYCAANTRNTNTTASKKANVAVLPALIEEGYTFVRLDQMPEYRQYETPESGSAVAEATPLPKSQMVRVSALK